MDQKWRRLIVRLLLKVYGIAVAVLSQRGEKFSSEEKKAMQMERGTKLLKRVWKGVVYAELAMMAGATLFIFSHYFSYSVFVSNLSSFHRLATAATPVQPR
jgi:hypothetical protein